MTEVELKVTRSVEHVHEKERRAFDVTKIVMEADWLLRTRQRLDRAKTRRQDLIIAVASIISVPDIDEP